MGLQKTITSIKVYAARETVVGLWPAVFPTGLTNDVRPFVFKWDRIGRLGAVDELVLSVHPGSIWHTEEVLNIRMRLVVEYSDATFDAWRIHDLSVGTGEQAGHVVRCISMDSDLAEYAFQFVNDPDTLINFRQPLVNRTVGAVLAILFTADQGLDTFVHKLGSVESTITSLEVSVLINRVNFMEVIRLLAEEVKIRHGLSLEYETVFDDTLKILTYNFFEEKGWHADERIAGSVDATKRPIDAPTGGTPDSSANRFFTRWRTRADSFFTRLFPRGGQESDAIDIQRIYWTVTGLPSYSAGPNTTTLDLLGSPIYKSGAYESYIIPLPPAGPNRCYLANASNVQYAVVTTTAPGTIVVVGDATAETELRFMFASAEVAFVEDHSAEALHGQVSRFIDFPDVAPFENLFEKAGGSPDMSDWSGGFPDGIEAFGASPVVVEVTDDVFVEHGTSAMKVSADIDEGVQTGAIPLLPTDLFAYHSWYVLIRVESGRVRIELIDQDGGVFPPVGQKYEGTADGYFAVRVGGHDPIEGDARLVLRAVEDATVFYVDAISVTNSVGPWDYSKDMGPKAIWAKAAEVLLEKGGIQSPTFDTRFIDVSELDAAQYEVHAGSHARIRDLFDGTVFRRIATGRCQEIREGDQGQDGTPFRTARFASYAESVATRLAFGRAGGGALQSVVGVRAPDEPAARRALARYAEVPLQIASSEDRCICGVATVRSGNTEVEVNVSGELAKLSGGLGAQTWLNYQPQLTNIGGWGGASKVWAKDITTSPVEQFTIEVDADPGQAIQFAYRACPCEPAAITTLFAIVESGASSKLYTFDTTTGLPSAGLWTERSTLKLGSSGLVVDLGLGRVFTMDAGTGGKVEQQDIGVWTVTDLFLADIRNSNVLALDPDNYLYYTLTSGTDAQIWRRDLDGTNPTNVTGVGIDIDGQGIDLDPNAPDPQLLYMTLGSMNVANPEHPISANLGSVGSLDPTVPPASSTLASLSTANTGAHEGHQGRVDALKGFYFCTNSDAPDELIKVHLATGTQEVIKGGAAGDVFGLSGPIAIDRGREHLYYVLRGSARDRVVRTDYNGFSEVFMGGIFGTGENLVSLWAA